MEGDGGVVARASCPLCGGAKGKNGKHTCVLKVVTSRESALHKRVVQAERFIDLSWKKLKRYDVPLVGARTLPEAVGSAMKDLKAAEVRIAGLERMVEDLALSGGRCRCFVANRVRDYAKGDEVDRANIRGFHLGGGPAQIRSGCAKARRKP